jgi:hypothetical protein
LRPKPAPGQFAEDQDDPFKDLRSDPALRIGSYGLHIDLHHHSLDDIVEAKAFAKAVKSDDADIPVYLYLWNDQITAPGVTDAKQDTALYALRKFGHRWFLRGLVWDCLEYIRATYGSIWRKPRHTQCGQATELGKDWDAIAGILWHSVPTIWGDYHAGSSLVHF